MKDTKRSWSSETSRGLFCAAFSPGARCDWKRWRNRSAAQWHSTCPELARPSEQYLMVGAQMEAGQLARLALRSGNGGQGTK